jgi:hypothetical protein
MSLSVLFQNDTDGCCAKTSNHTRMSTAYLCSMTDAIAHHQSVRYTKAILGTVWSGCPLGIGSQHSPIGASVMLKPIISSDSHITEPPGTYVDRIDKKYKDTAPHIVRDAGSGGTLGAQSPVTQMGHPDSPDRSNLKWDFYSKKSPNVKWAMWSFTSKRIVEYSGIGTPFCYGQ